jgi:4-aminobutyrate--pyruvate transaminase
MGSSELNSNNPTLPLLPAFQRLSDNTRENTIVMTSGKGIFVYDDQGNEYLEATSSFYGAVLGYGDEELIAAIEEQLHKLPFYPPGVYRGNDKALELADKLVSMVPLKDARVAFGTSGSEANEYALKMILFRNIARGEVQRKKVISRIGCYHGSTIVAASMTSGAGENREFGLPLAGYLSTIQPDYFNLHYKGEDESQFVQRNVETIEQLILKEDPETIAAFIAEPVSYNAGLAIPPQDYFPKLKSMLEEYNVELIVDEVVTGFGRTGNMFGSQTFNIEPSCMTFAKGFSSAYIPISAAVIPGYIYDEIEKEVDRLGFFGHGATYQGHAVASAAALKTIEIIEQRELPAYAAKAGEYLLKKVSAYDSHPLVINTRGIGLSAVIEFRHDDDSGYPGHYPCQFAELIYQKAPEHGLIVRQQGAAILFTPPLITTHDEIDEIFRRFDLALQAAEAEQYD